MNYSKWILSCLGVFQDGDYLDELEKNFQSDALDEEEDMLEEIRICMECDRHALGNQIAMRIFEDVIQRAVSELGAKEEDFEHCTNGSLDTWINCKGEQVTSWEDIEEIYNKENEEELD